MLDFLTQYFYLITYGFEIIAAITGIVCFNKFKLTPVKYFIYFLVYVVFVELMGAMFIFYKDFLVIRFLRSLGLRTTSWFNLFWMFGSILFIYFYFFNQLKSKRGKQVIKLASGLFIILMLGHFIVFSNLFFTVHSPFYQLFGAVSTFICIALYLTEFIKSESILNLFRTFGFYASISLLIWWLIITPVLFYDTYNTSLDMDFVFLKRRIFLFANIFMYTCFTIGLIVSKPELKND